MPMQMLTRNEQNQVLQNHVVAANAVFNKVAVFKKLIQQEPHNAMYYEEVQRVQKKPTHPCGHQTPAHSLNR